jgi:hypothetical protein
VPLGVRVICVPGTIAKEEITMTAARATDEVTDAIAYIEMYRQVADKETGLAAACSDALRKLHELLEQEKAAPGQLDPDSGYQANIEAVTLEIRRIQTLAGGKRQGAQANSRRPVQHHPSDHSGARRPEKNRGRRQAGRRGSR